MRVVNFILCVFVVALNVRLWGGDASLATVWQLEQDITEQRAENATLTTRNQRLAAEVHDLKTGLETVEASARRDLGMVRRDETYFHFVEH